MNKPPTNKLPISEHFYSFQGEGVNQGKPSYFIRTMGCPVKCPWCDSAETWDGSGKAELLSPEFLANEASKHKLFRAIITGGEPAIHDLTELTIALAQRSISSSIETSGAFGINGNFGWITVSPKTYRLPIESAFLSASEFKLVVDSPETLKFWIDNYWTNMRHRPIWLHPEWSVRDKPGIKEAILDCIKSYGPPLRAGWQIHKEYRVR